MTFETLTEIFAGIGVAACLWWAVVLAGRLRGRAERPANAGEQAAASQGRGSPPVSPPENYGPVNALAPSKAEEAGGVSAEHVAAIAAAVAASGYRVVHIADPASGSAWVSEGRWIHQTSHRTH